MALIAGLTMSLCELVHIAILLCTEVINITHKDAKMMIDQLQASVTRMMAICSLRKSQIISRGFAESVKTRFETFFLLPFAFMAC